MTVHYEGYGVTVHHGDCLDVLKELPDASVDAVITDPPYDLTSGKKGGTGVASVNIDSPAGRSMIGTGFMGKSWDGTGIAFRPDVWAECLRVLKPGGHLLAFGGTRTFHRMACAIEDAGLEIRDSLAWLYGTGFPKSLDVSKAIDRAAGADRERGPRVGGALNAGTANGWSGSSPDSSTAPLAGTQQIGPPITDDAVRWQGWGTALRPCHEPIVVARKPLKGTVAQNVLTYGTGALNIDATRLATTENLNGGAYAEVGGRTESPSLHGGSGMNVPGKTAGKDFVQPSGRWPANVVVSHAPDCRPVGTAEVSSNGHYPASRGRGGIGNTGHSGQEGLVERAERTEVVTAWACAPGCQVAALDGQTGELSQNDSAVWRSDRGPGMLGGIGSAKAGSARIGHGDSGGASRFFKQVEPDAQSQGRWPPNVVVDEAAAAVLDEQNGMSKDGVAVRRNGVSGDSTISFGAKAVGSSDAGYGGEGGPSRFFKQVERRLDDLPIRAFYTAKASGVERPEVQGVQHVTVKPLDLMKWLVKLVTPPGGMVLDPFGGSGTTAEAALVEGMRCTIIEREAEYLPLIVARVTRQRDPVGHHRLVRTDDDEPTLFD